MNIDKQFDKIEKSISECIRKTKCDLNGDLRKKWTGDCCPEIALIRDEDTSIIVTAIIEPEDKDQVMELMGEKIEQGMKRLTTKIAEICSIDININVKI